MTDNSDFDSDYDFGFVTEDGLSQDDSELLQTAERDQVAMAQLVNNQQARMPDTMFHGSTMTPSMSHEDYVDSLIADATMDVTIQPDAQIQAVKSASVGIDKSAIDTKDDANDDTDNRKGLGIKYRDIQYKPGDLLPSIKPSFIKQYYIRFITNICTNLVTNPTVRAINSAQTRMHHHKYMVPSRNLVNNVNDDLDSKLAQSVFTEVNRYGNEGENRLVYWHIPKLSVLNINKRTLAPITQHDVILPVYDDIFRECYQQTLANFLLSHYSALYMRLPLTTREYSEDFDPHHNPQYIKKLTSLQQSINFLKTNCWYLFTSQLNALFANKRKKPLSYARGYLLTLSRHYDNSSVVFNERLIKQLGERVQGLRYWVDNANHGYLNLTSSQPQISKRYAHHSITSHQLGYEILSMLSKPIIKSEPLNNLNYDLDNGILYLAGMNEVLRFWVKRLTAISDDNSAENINLRNSILKTATKKARTFYPPSALYLED